MNYFLQKPYIIKKKSFIFFCILTLYLLLLFFAKEKFQGILAVFSIALILFFISKRYESLSTILYVALFLRLILIFIGNHIITLPDSWGDAKNFELRAWEYSQDGFFDLFNNFPAKDPSYHISWILSFFYSLFGRSPLLCQSISLIFGIGSILICCRIVTKIWNSEFSIKVGWILALYPTLILYSSLILREAYVWFFLLIAVYGIVSFLKDKSLTSLITTFIGFFLATFFHGGMVFGGLFFLIFIILLTFQEILRSVQNFKISKRTLITIVFLTLILIYFFVFIQTLPKKLSLKYLLDFEFLIQEITQRNINAGRFPEWTIPKSFSELIFKAPIRIIYFLFSPFPWDINKPIHIIGIFDSFFYFILVFLIFKNFKKIWSDQTLKIVFILLLVYLFLFGVSSGNFGTGIRHRTKFLFVILLIVAPWLPNISLKNINIKN